MVMVVILPVVHHHNLVRVVNAPANWLLLIHFISVPLFSIFLSVFVVFKLLSRIVKMEILSLRLELLLELPQPLGIHLHVLILLLLLQVAVPATTMPHSIIL